jgi:hypothetical protein
MVKSKFEIKRVSGMPVTDVELIGDLKRVATQMPKGTVGHKEYRKLGRFDDSTITRRFGSWNAALRLAGLAVSNEAELSDEILYENILNLWSHYGRQPRRSELAQPPSKVSQSPYNRRFGSWGKALAGFVEYANSGDVDSTYRDRSGDTMAREKRTSRDPSLRLRFRVMQRDSFACCSCGAAPAKTPGVDLHVDHVVPWSKGGETVFENLQTLCSQCNLGKGDL